MLNNAHFGITNTPRAFFKGKIGSVFGGKADLKFANSTGGGYEHPSPRPTILFNSITYDNIVCIDPDNVCFSIGNSIGIAVDCGTFGILDGKVGSGRVDPVVDAGGRKRVDPVVGTWMAESQEVE